MSFDFFNQNQAQPGSGPELGPNGEESAWRDARGGERLPRGRERDVPSLPSSGWGAHKSRPSLTSDHPPSPPPVRIPPPSTAVLIDVRCGRINVAGKAMAPDERKGKLRVCKATDGLCHLQWGSRAEGMPFVPEDDFIIFPQESVMKFIPKPGVFVIKFPDDVSRNMFFWSQEPAGRFDDETLTARVNAALSGEHPDDAAPSAAPSIAARSAAIRQAQQAANSALAPRPDETPAATATVADTPAAPAKAKSDERSPAAPPSAVSGEALRAALGNLGGGGQGGSGSDAASAMAAMLSGMGGGPGPGGARARGPGLGDVLTPETVGPLLRGEDVRARLMEHLPEEHRDSQDLEELLRTPQFQSQLERFSAALTSGQMDLAQFGLQPGTGFSVAEFLSAIQALAEKEKREKGEGKDKATE